jgi:hypothetical protein
MTGQKWTDVQPEERHLEAGAQGGQHYNGQAERIIGLLNLCLEQTLDRKQCSIEEVKALLYKAAQTVNSRPIARGKLQRILPAEDQSPLFNYSWVEQRWTGESVAAQTFWISKALFLNLLSLFQPWISAKRSNVNIAIFITRHQHSPTSRNLTSTTLFNPGN